MKSLISIVGKNMKIISRSKLSTFFVLLAPLLIVFLVGTAFNSNSLSNIKLGVYSAEYNELSNSIVTNLGGKQFVVQKMNSEQECINSVKAMTIHACIIFPKNMSIEKNNESIVLHIDNSRINIAYILINDINSKISEKGSELGMSMASDLLKALQQAKSSLPSQEEQINSALSDISEIQSETSAIASQISSIDSAITSINSGLSSTNDSSVESDLTSIKTKLESLKLGLSGGTSAIESKSQSGETSLTKVSEEIGKLIQNISKITISTPENIVMPIKTEINSISKDSTNWKNLFPTLTALIVLLSSIILSASLVLDERRAKANFRNFMTPTSDLSFILGTYVTCMIILFAQMVLLFLGTILLTNLEVYSVLPQIALILFLSSSAFIFLGMFIGYVFKSDETTILATISVASLLIFFSNTILPTESIAGDFKYVAMYNPLFITDLLIKKTILFNAAIQSLIPEMLVLLGGMLLFLVLTLFGRKITKRKA